MITFMTEEKENIFFNNNEAARARQLNALNSYYIHDSLYWFSHSSIFLEVTLQCST